MEPAWVLNCRVEEEEMNCQSQQLRLKWIILWTMGSIYTRWVKRDTADDARGGPEHFASVGNCFMQTFNSQAGICSANVGKRTRCARKSPWWAKQDTRLLDLIDLRKHISEKDVWCFGTIFYFPQLFRLWPSKTWNIGLRWEKKIQYTSYFVCGCQTHVLTEFSLILLN